MRAALVQLEEDWSAAHARRDSAALASLLAAEYVGVAATGEFGSKAEEMAQTRAGTGFDPAASNPAQALDSVRVRLYGDVALMTSRITAQGGARPGAAPERYYYTSAYVWRDGRWQAVQGHISRAAKKK